MFRGNLNAYSDEETQNAFDRINERTDGLLKITTVPHGTLPIKGPDQLRAVSAGELEMCLGQGDYHSGDFPPFGITNVGFLAHNQLDKAKLAESCRPIFEKELNKMNVHILAYQPYAANGFWTVDDIEDITDMTGIKLRAQAKIFTNIVEAMNGVPVYVEWPETYTALQRGLVKGVFTGFDSTTSAKLQEVAPYAHNIGLSALLPFIVVNNEKWNELPLDIQLIVTEELMYSMMKVQAYVPQNLSDEVQKQLAAGLKKYNSEPPAGWFDLMNEKVTIPSLQEEVEKNGALGQEILTVIEEALGRKVI